MTLAGFNKAVVKAASVQSPAELAKALSALVAKRQAKRAFPKAWGFGTPTPRAQAATPRARSRARRVGFKKYSVTGKYDASRYGTFRKYMLNTIVAHSNTASAQRAHAACEEPKFAKNKLDFNWAADNGFITLI